ncbi:MAG: hypothetical protein AAB614_02290 [Patescibacteria group bacterium]
MEIKKDDDEKNANLLVNSGSEKDMLKPCSCRETKNGDNKSDGSNKESGMNDGCCGGGCGCGSDY